MDSARFDGLVRRFDQTRSRRQTLRGLAGAVAIGALAEMGLLRPAAAQDGVRCDHCETETHCADGFTCCTEPVNGAVGTEHFVPGHCIPATKRYGCHRGVTYSCPRGAQFQVVNRKPKCCERTSGRCEPAEAICLTCKAQRAPCTRAGQCCATDHTACAPNNVIIGENVCCSTLGGACREGGPSGDCCGVNLQGGSDYAYCSPGGACGGPGATCRFNEVCVSGVCCKVNPTDDSGKCCQTGETCAAGGQCVG